MDWLWVVFNTGGPMSRTRKEIISSSLLDNERSGLRWPRRLQVGIAFPAGVRPSDYMNHFIASRGFAGPDDCKGCVDLPSGTYFCRTTQVDEQARTVAESAQPDELLRAALILGLCSSHSFSSGRPVIWTNSRLTRTVALYEIGSFYGSD